jgi:ParB family chromosome partitioning protein
MQSIVSANPYRCRMWTLHERFQKKITADTCAEEIESFARHGQLVPVLGRVLHGDPAHDIELVYGARRLFVARLLGKPINVELRDLSDREAIVAMDIENRLRKDISPYERGLSYAQWLRAGYFTAQDDIAQALNVSASQVSRLLKLARLPSVVVAAFASPLEICETWGLDLSAALEDPQRKPAILRAARAIHSASPRPSARKVYRLLLAGSRRRPSAQSHDEIVKSVNGVPLFRIRHQMKSICLILPIERAQERSLERIQQAITEIIQRASLQPADCPANTAVSITNNDESRAA